MGGLWRVAICALALVLGGGLAAGCGSESEQDLQEQLRAGAEQGADQLAAKYGMSEDALDCIVDGIVQRGESMDLSGLTGDDVEAQAQELGKGAAGKCIAKPGLTIMEAQPTEAQASAVLKLTKGDLEQGLISGGLPPSAGECVFERLAASLSPDEVAELINGAGVPELKQAIAACA